MTQATSVTLDAVLSRLRRGERVEDAMIREALALANLEISDLAAALLTAVTTWRCPCGGLVRVYSTRATIQYGRCPDCGARAKRRRPVRATA